MLTLILIGLVAYAIFEVRKLRTEMRQTEIELETIEPTKKKSWLDIDFPEKE